VTLEEGAYPVKLDKAVSPLVGRGLLECDPLLLTWLAASRDGVLRALFTEGGSRTAEL